MFHVRCRPLSVTECGTWWSGGAADVDVGDRGVLMVFVVAVVEGGAVAVARDVVGTETAPEISVSDVGLLVSSTDVPMCAAGRWFVAQVARQITAETTATYRLHHFWAGCLVKRRRRSLGGL